MRLFGCHWLAVSSVFLTIIARAETRPQYGGTLHVMTRVALRTLDPAESREADSFARRSISSFLFDTLVVMDETGRPKAALAESWQAANGNQRWQFRLRRGVKFHDGTPVTTDIVAASLQLANPSWGVRAETDLVTVDCDEPDPEMPAEMALPRNAIAKRDGQGNVSGTGPFHIVDWQPGKKLTLAAEEDCWRGRPFLDGIEIEMGRNFRDQTAGLEAGRADVIEVAPEQAHRFSPTKSRLANSPAVELMALVFTRDVPSQEERLLREALALSVDRESIHSVLLQGAGQATGSLLPTWISGYGFSFSSQSDMVKARQLRDQVASVRVWTIGYDTSDTLARFVVERIALNAKDARLSLLPVTSGPADLRLARIPLASSEPWVTLRVIVAETGLPQFKNKTSVEDLFATEQTTLATRRVIPLFHLPVFYAASTNMKEWSVRKDGSLDLASAWLGAAK